MKSFFTFFLFLTAINYTHAQNGSLDKSYGQGGITLTRAAILGGTASASAIQADDKVLIGGYFQDSAAINSLYNGTNLVLQRYSKDGTLDESFGNEGNVVWRIDSPYIGAYSNGWTAISIQPDGRILATTSLYKKDWSLEPPYNDRADVALARFKADGSPDSSFGTNGMVITDVNGQNADIKAMALQKDGKIVLTGQITDNAYDNGPILVIRYNADGTLDKTFGKGTGYVAGKDVGYTNRAILIQPDGKILCGGSASEFSDYLFSLFRYLPDGTPDAAFGANGKVQTFFSETIFTKVNSLLLLEDGRILAGGIAANKLYADNMTVVRYLANGAVDESFGKKGKAFVSYGGDTNSTVIRLFVKPDGKVLLAGTCGDFINGTDISYDFALAQLLPNGSLDSSFGNNGKTSTDLNNGSTDDASGAVIQSDDDVVITGTAYTYESSTSYYQDYALDRYHTGGKAERPIVIKIKRFLHNHGIVWQGTGSGVSYYSIERSSSGAGGFREIGRVPNSGSQSYYYAIAPAAADRTASTATDYYRVRAVSGRGQSLSSNIVALSSNEEDGLKVYPNPASSAVTIGGLDPERSYRITVTDAGGAVRLAATARGQATATLNVSSLKKGNYRISLWDSAANRSFAFFKE